MQSVVDRNVVMRRIPLCCARHKLLPHDFGVYIVPGRNIVSPRLTVQVRYGTDTVPAFPGVFHYTTNKLFHIFLSVHWCQGRQCRGTLEVCWLWPAVSSQLLHGGLSVYARLGASCGVTYAEYFNHRATVIGYIDLFQNSKDMCSFSVTLISA